MCGSIYAAFLSSLSKQRKSCRTVVFDFRHRLKSTKVYTQCALADVCRYAQILVKASVPSSNARFSDRLISCCFC